MAASAGDSARLWKGEAVISPRAALKGIERGLCFWASAYFVIAHMEKWPLWTFGMCGFMVGFCALNGWSEDK
jgi:hypothetical protein